MAKKVTTTTTTTVVTEEITEQKKVTRIALVIDRSGSMGSVYQSAFDGINEQIGAIKANAEKGGDTYVTYIQFDGEIETVFANRHASELVPITREQYQPRGMTALYDGVGRALNTLQAQTVEGEDTAYLLVVISDGAENASREFNSTTVATRIKQLEATGKWTVTMMLSNVDLSVATNLGVNLGNVSLYSSTAAGTSTAFSTMASSTANYFSARSAGLESVRSFYSDGVTPPNPVLTFVTGSTVTSAQLATALLNATGSAI